MDKKCLPYRSEGEGPRVARLCIDYIQWKYSPMKTFSLITVWKEVLECETVCLVTCFAGMKFFSIYKLQ